MHVKYKVGDGSLEKLSVGHSMNAVHVMMMNPTSFIGKLEGNSYIKLTDKSMPPMCEPQLGSSEGDEDLTRIEKQIFY
jgi:hypothetical protein